MVHESGLLVVGPNIILWTNNLCTGENLVIILELRFCYLQRCESILYLCEFPSECDILEQDKFQLSC